MIQKSHGTETDLLIDPGVARQSQKSIGRQTLRQRLDGGALLPDLGALLAAGGVELVNPSRHVGARLADDDAVEAPAVLEVHDIAVESNTAEFGTVVFQATFA